MILTATLNPCLDKTLIVPPWKSGDLVRGRRVHEVVGGKGNNVARVLHRLGRSVRPATFLGGPIGRYCEDLLRRDDGLDPIIVWTAAPTRVILTVRTDETSTQSAFFDPDPAVQADESAELRERIATQLAGGGVEALTLSGSSPHPNTHSLYAEWIALARARQIPVFLDTYGPALEAVVAAWPDVLQVNRKEAAGRLKKQESELIDADVIGLLNDWARRGTTLAVVTDGPRPVLFQAHGRLFRAIPPAIEAVNPIGSGDSLLAGIADAWLGGASTEEIMRNGIACATANALVWDPGDVDPAEVARRRDGVAVEPLVNQ